MSPKLKKFLEGWAINTLAVGLAGLIIHNHITYHGNFLYLILASLLLGVLNSALKPVMKFIAPPLLLFTLGLFRFVMNALVLYFVGFLLRPYFSVDSFWSAFTGALVISIVSAVMNLLVWVANMRMQIRRMQPPVRRDDGPPGSSGPGGSGPVIDV